MKKTYIILSIAVLSVFLPSVFIDNIFAKVSGAKTTISQFSYYLTTHTWQLKQIEVDGNYYSDSISTDIHLQFLTDGNLIINDNDTIPIPWQFQDTTAQKIVLNQGTTEEQIFNIHYLDYDYFIYDVDYHVVDASHNMDTTYNYVFKFAAEE